MPVPQLYIWVPLIVCCTGFIIPQQPAPYYDYNGQPYQWQPSSYQSQPSHYYHQSCEYDPSYYSSYSSGYYYYPHVYANPGYHRNDLHTTHLDHGLSHYEAEKLLQVYRIIRVVAIFRTPPKSPKKITSLDVLLHRLTKQKLQEQLVALVNHLHGYEELAKLTHGHPGHDTKFVNDNARLLAAIQRALNALNLDAYDHDPHHHKGYGFCELHKELCGELRRLRDKANALTVAQIKKELLGGYKPEMKQEMEDLDENLQSRDLEDVEVDGNEEAMPVDNEYVEVEALNELITALELYLQQQKIAEEKIQEAVGQPDSMTSTTSSPLPATYTEGSWFGSVFGKGDGAADNQTDNGSKPMTETNNKPNEPNAWVHEDVVEKEPHDFDIDERFQTATNAWDSSVSSTVTHSVPIWLSEDTEKPESRKWPPPNTNTTKEIKITEKRPESRQDPDDVPESPVELPVDGQLEQQQPEVTTEVVTSSTATNDQLTSSTTTAAPTFDARRFVKGQVLSVLSMLEEAKGFTELKEHISNPDVDQLVAGLSDVEAGVRWTEMITALQNLVVDKQLNRTEQIVNVLEHWKKGARGQLDNGYFSRTYGASQDVEARGLEGSHTPFVDDVDNFFNRSYGLNNKTANETQGHYVTNDQIPGFDIPDSETEDRDPRVINVDVAPKFNSPTPNSSATSKQQEGKVSETIVGSTTEPPLTTEAVEF